MGNKEVDKGETIMDSIDWNGNQTLVFSYLMSSEISCLKFLYV